jgi:hypothetical protein
LLVVAPMLTFACWALHRSFPTAARMRAALVGTACGVAAVLFLALHCGIALTGHVVLGHGLALLTAILVGSAVIGPVARA